MAILNWRTTDGQAGRCTIARSPLRIGRADGNDLVIPDGSVSSTHAELSLENGQLAVRDLGSTNGTFMYEQRVTQVLVSSGQSFRLGSAELTFEGGSPNLSAAGVAPALSAGGGARISLSASIAPSPSAPNVPSGGEALPNFTGAACFQHQHAAARYTCPKCAHDLCSECVQLQKVGPKDIPFCRTCGSQCALQGQSVIPKPEVIPPFKALLPGAFSFPFKGNGIILLVTGTIFFGFLDLLTSSPVSMARSGGWMIKIIFYGYLFAYMQKIVLASADGEKEPPTWPEVTDMGQDIIHPFLLFVGSVLASFAPGFILYLSEPLAGNALMLLGAFYFPMALLAVAMADSLRGLNPAVVVSAIMKVPKPYLVAVIVCALLVMVRAVLPGVAARLGIPIVPYFILAFFGLLLVMIEMRILGLLYYTNKPKFGWF